MFLVGRSKTRPLTAAIYPGSGPYYVLRTLIAASPLEIFHESRRATLTLEAILNQWGEKEKERKRELSLDVLRLFQVTVPLALALSISHQKSQAY